MLFSIADATAAFAAACPADVADHVVAIRTTVIWGLAAANVFRAVTDAPDDLVAQTTMSQLCEANNLKAFWTCQAVSPSFATPRSQFPLF